jgi:hypothetical protein
MKKIVRFESSHEEPYPLQVQGESFYRKNIEDVSNYLGEEEGVDADDFIAQLHLEDDNEVDPGNAVRVEIDGKTVGHLAKAAAKKYRKKLTELGLEDVVGECYARIRGGFVMKNNVKADFGVRLDLIIDEMKELKMHSLSQPQIHAEPPTQPRRPIEDFTGEMNEPQIQARVTVMAKSQIISKTPSMADRAQPTMAATPPKKPASAQRLLTFTIVAFVACFLFLAVVRMLAAAR